MDFQPDQPQSTKVLCCECGVLIDHNALNTCLQCIQSKIDITDGITKQAILQFCNKCDRYLQPPNVWINATLESRQLLAVCLKRIKGLNKVTLIDASFVWTEPHSKRIKVKIVVQKEVSGAYLQQTAVCEFNVVNQTCDDCHRVEAKDYWNAVVQVRQRVEHKKTFYYLEQIILKLNMHSNCVSIKQVHDGIDFYYANKEAARKMVDFLESVVPMRFSTSKRLISHDIHSNTYNYKYTISIEIVPICKDNIICLPQQLSRQLGGFGPICICTKVTKLIHLIDPQSLLMTEIDANTYWRAPFTSLCTPKQLREYIVMDIEQTDSHNRRHAYGKESKKHVLADAWVIKSKELTHNNQQHHTKTHLGHLLNCGDLALGFDFANANINDANLDAVKSDNIPDIILVKKVYSDEKERQRKRKWKLNRLKIQHEGSVATSDDRDYQDFLKDIEEDPELRENINIFKDKNKLSKQQQPTKQSQEQAEESGDVPEISLEEMLDELDINDNMDTN